MKNQSEVRVLEVEIFDLDTSLLKREIIKGKGGAASILGKYISAHDYANGRTEMELIGENRVKGWYLFRITDLFARIKTIPEEVLLPIEEENNYWVAPEGLAYKG